MANPSPSVAVRDEKPAPRRFQWLTNNEPRGRILVLRGAANPISKSLAPGPEIPLIPGANLVDAKLWARWKDENADREIDGDLVVGMATRLLKHEIPRARHAANRMEREGQPILVEGPAVARRDAPIADLDESQARAIVAEILSEPVLRGLLANERRSSVSEAIRGQMSTITDGGTSKVA